MSRYDAWAKEQMDRFGSVSPQLAFQYAEMMERERCGQIARQQQRHFEEQAKAYPKDMRYQHTAVACEMIACQIEVLHG
jgi:hypothetical protein